MRALRARVRANPVDRWAASFVGKLREAPRGGPIPDVTLASAEAIRRETARIGRATRLVLMLDYDGTLVPFAPTPELATPDPDLLALLQALAARPATEVHLVSGRQRENLETWLGELAVGLHAEHGLWSRPMGTPKWERHELAQPVPYDDLLDVLHRFTERTPGSAIERKSAGLAWHFRLAQSDLGTAQAEAVMEEVRRRFPPDDRRSVARREGGGTPAGRSSQGPDRDPAVAGPASRHDDGGPGG